MPLPFVFFPDSDPDLEDPDEEEDQEDEDPDELPLSFLKSLLNLDLPLLSSLLFPFPASLPSPEGRLRVLEILFFFTTPLLVPAADFELPASTAVGAVEEAYRGVRTRKRQRRERKSNDAVATNTALG